MRSFSRNVFLLFIALVPFILASAQRPKIKHGTVSSKDFEVKSYAIDSSADAVVLAHIGEANYEGNTKGGFSIRYKVHLRMRILNRKAFDAATISIPLYQGRHGMVEELEKLEAYTFNHVNGSVEKSKLDNGSLFKEKVNNKYVVQKFTMPNLQEGCIIDIRYIVLSPFERNLDGWKFQGAHPSLWSEYSVSVPEIYDFVTITQGYHPFAKVETNLSSATYNIVQPGGSERNETFTYTGQVKNTTWSMENIPAIKPETFTTTLENHLAKLSFQLSYIKYPNTPIENVKNTWQAMATDLLKHPDFGEELTGNLNWLRNEVKAITNKGNDSLEGAKEIYKYVRDNFTCNTHRGVYKTASLRNVFKNKSGSVADINLLLTAMLTVQGFTATPVVLSTRDNGVMNDIYPIEERMNYVVTHLSFAENDYLLDASYTQLGFGSLPHQCYNGSARLIDKEQPYIVKLSADSIVETKMTSIFLVSSANGKMNGSLNTTLGRFESYDLRETLMKTTPAEYMKTIRKSYPEHITISDIAFDALKDLEQPISLRYSMDLPVEEDVLYINPLFSEAQKTNPFKAASRFYPVEMPYSFNELVSVRIDIPEGYEVDEIPKSKRVMYNEDEGMFEYLFSSDKSMIQVKSLVKLNRATFFPEDYESLREFFAYIVKCHSEQIVLKKKKS